MSDEERSGTAAMEHMEQPAAQSYEQARDELIAVVGKLEAGGTTLEESLALWERGEELSRICQAWLDGARERLQRSIDGPDAKDDE